MKKKAIQKKKKKIKNDIYNKGDDYRFNEKKIQPCYNEVELKYHNEKESELSNKDDENKRELKSMSYTERRNNNNNDNNDNNNNDKNNLAQKIEEENNHRSRR